MLDAVENASSLSFGDFTIDRADERLLGPHGPVKLGNKAFRVLLLLAEQQGRLLTKDALFSSVWDGTIVSESALTSVIKELRRALGDESRTPRYIESVYGRGYRFIEPVREGAAPEAAPASPSLAPAKAAPPPAERLLGQPPLLYVPPFQMLAAADSRPQFAEVLREEVLFALSRFREIRLVLDVDDDAKLAGGGFGERDYRLSVKLLPDAQAVRVFARLSRLSTQAVIWGETIDLSGNSLAPDVDALVRKIAAAALPRLQDDVLSNLPAQAHDAYELYLHTRLKMRRAETLAEAQDTAATWERLIAEHPSFFPAYPPLTRLYNTDFCFSGIGSSTDETRARAYDLAHQALAIEPNESNLHTARGWSHLWVGEQSLARQHLREALQLNPYNQRRLIEVGTGFLFLEDLDDAADLLERAQNLSPFAGEAPRLEQGLLHLLREEFDAAAEKLALARRNHPDDFDRTEPSIMSELYALLAAAGADAPDLEQRSRRWRESMARRWSRPEPLDEAALKQWVLYHNPFQSSDRKKWLLGLVERAIAA